MPFLASLASLLLVSGPASPLADLAAARALASQGQPALAEQTLEHLCATFPTWGLAHLELGELLLDRGALDAPELEKAVRRATEHSPENPRAWLLAGRYHDLRNEPEAAVRAWLRATELRPDLLLARERAGTLLAQGRRCAEAVPHLEAVLAARPDERSARANLADAYECLGRILEAEAHHAELLRRNPQSSVFRRRFAQFYERTGRPHLAERVLRGEPKAKRALRPLPPSRR